MTDNRRALSIMTSRTWRDTAHNHKGPLCPVSLLYFNIPRRLIVHVRTRRRAVSKCIQIVDARRTQQRPQWYDVPSASAKLFDVNRAQRMPSFVVVAWIPLLYRALRVLPARIRPTWSSHATGRRPERHRPMLQSASTGLQLRQGTQSSVRAPEIFIV